MSTNYNSTCISYFNSLTQGNVPFRQENNNNLASYSVNGEDSWYYNSSATEYECLGIGYTDINNNSNSVPAPPVAYYLNATNWEQIWQSGVCVNLFQEMLLGAATSQPIATFDPTGFKYVRDDFIFMLSRYFNQDSSTPNTRVSNIPPINTYFDYSQPTNKTNPYAVYDNSTNVIINSGSYDTVNNKVSSIDSKNPYSQTFQVSSRGPFQVNDKIKIFFTKETSLVDAEQTNDYYAYFVATITNITPNTSSNVTTYSFSVNITQVTIVNYPGPVPTAGAGSAPFPPPSTNLPPYNVNYQTRNPPLSPFIFSPAKGAPGTMTVPDNVTNSTTNPTYTLNYQPLADYYFQFQYYNPGGDIWIGSVNTLSNPKEFGYKPFLRTLLNACAAMPGVCEPVQSYMCNQCNRDQITSSNAFLTFCGCNSNSTLTNNTFYSNTLSNFDPACDPLCTNSRAIQNVDTTTGITEQCNANVCVIDNVSINAVDTTFGQLPSFTQVCPACADGTGNCVCIINANFSNVSSIAGYDGNPINDYPRFLQVCPNSQCFDTDPTTGLYRQTDCTDSLTDKSGKLLSNVVKEIGTPVKFPVWIVVICGVLLFVIILVFFAYKYQSDNIQVYMTSKIPVYPNNVNQRAYVPNFRR
jgi:hypothetical protein